MEEKILFEKNQGIKARIIHKIKGKRIYISFDRPSIKFENLKELIYTVNQIQSVYKNIKIPITLDLKNVKMADKLTMIMIEAICNYVISECKRPLKVELNDKTDAITCSMNSSILWILQDEDREHIEKFQRKYERDLWKNHYRRIISGEDSSSSSIVSDVASEVDSFLKPFSISEDAAIEVGELVSELLSNVKEHTDSSCIIDIDITPSKYTKIGEMNDNRYYGINIAVVNFSELLLNSGLKSLFLTKNPDELDGRYKKVMQAYKYHKRFFDNDYTEEDFFNFVAFQNKISGREIIESTGGTGLTQIIKSLEKRADNHLCYVVSGDRRIGLLPEYLKYNDGWIGFNEENDFFTNIPSSDVYNITNFYMPGTAFNINLVMKKEK